MVKRCFGVSYILNVWHHYDEVRRFPKGSSSYPGITHLWGKKMRFLNYLNIKKCIQDSNRWKARCKNMIIHLKMIMHFLKHGCSGCIRLCLFFCCLKYPKNAYVQTLIQSQGVGMESLLYWVGWSGAARLVHLPMSIPMLRATHTDLHRHRALSWNVMCIIRVGGQSNPFI